MAPDQSAAEVSCTERLADPNEAPLQPAPAATTAWCTGSPCSLGHCFVALNLLIAIISIFVFMQGTHNPPNAALTPLPRLPTPVRRGPLYYLAHSPFWNSATRKGLGGSQGCQEGSQGAWRSQELSQLCLG